MTGLKNSPPPTSAAAMKRCTPAARHGETISMLSHASGSRLAVGRSLVDPQHVRHGSIPEPIERAEDIHEHVGEAGSSGIVERWQIGYVPLGCERDRDREDRRVRHPSPPAADTVDVALAGVVVGDPAIREEPPRPRRHVVVGIDLSVRVRDRRPHFRAAVLEDEYVRHVGSGPELGRALGPEVDDPAGAVDTERGERRIVVRGVEHDFAAIPLHRRPAVPEPAHVVGIRRLEPTGAERAAARRKVRAGLARTDDVDAVLRVRIGAQSSGIRHVVAAPVSRGGAHRWRCRTGGAIRAWR